MCCFDRDFAPEPRVSDEQIEELQRELMRESQTLELLDEQLRGVTLEPVIRAIGLARKQEIDRLGEIAEARLLEALTEDCE